MNPGPAGTLARDQAIADSRGISDHDTRWRSAAGRQLARGSRPPDGLPRGGFTPENAVHFRERPPSPEDIADLQSH